MSLGRPTLRRPCHFLAAAFVLLLLPFVAGCDGDSSSPTEDKSYFLTFGGSISPTSGRGLRTIELLLDGRVVARRDATNGIIATWIHSEFVKRGRHTFAVRVTGQTRSPTRYVTGGGVDGIDELGNKVVDEDFGQTFAFLATGERVEWEFRF